MLDAKVVGSVLQRLREERGLSQEIVSGLAGIGRTHLSAIERGERKPTLETFYRIGEALHMRPSAVLAEIEAELRGTMGRIISSALARGTDPVPAIRVLRDENLQLQQERAELLASLGYPADYLEEKPACAKCGDTGYVSGGVCACLRAYYAREQLAELRRELPHTFFLVPGYGAQGGGARDVAGAFDKDGLGAVINSSRGILCAWKKEDCAPEDYAGAARREALRMKADITSVLYGWLC